MAIAKPNAPPAAYEKIAFAIQFCSMGLIDSYLE